MPGLIRHLIPLPIRPRSIERVHHLEYSAPEGRALHLDLYRRRSQEGPRPTLVYAHGGGWVIGDKREQGLPMLHHFASQGWLCASVNYRLSPRATWPACWLWRPTIPCSSRRSRPVWT